MAMRKTLAIIIGTSLMTALGVVLVANLSLGNKQIDRRIKTLYTVDDPQFLRSMGSLLGPPMVDGNRAQALVNGNEIFPAMLEAIRGAQHTITFETYIYWSGTIGQQFAQALTERARAGVRVHVMLDWLGSGEIDLAYVKQMEAGGVEVLHYNPLRWDTIARMNNRTHRKLLVVDGKIGFTGGVGIADPWTGNAQNPQHWRDTHFRVEGPVVAQMQSAFLDNWIEVSGHVLHGAAYFPSIERVAAHTAQVFTSSPGGGAESVQLMYLLSIAAARRPRCRYRCRTSFPITWRSIHLSLQGNGEFACRSSSPVRTPTGSCSDARRASNGARYCAPVWRSTSTSRRCSTAR